MAAPPQPLLEQRRRGPVSPWHPCWTESAVKPRSVTRKIPAPSHYRLRLEDLNSFRAPQEVLALETRQTRRTRTKLPYHPPWCLQRHKEAQPTPHKLSARVARLHSEDYLPAGLELPGEALERRSMRRALPRPGEQVQL